MEPSGPVGTMPLPIPQTVWWRVHENIAGTRRCNGGRTRRRPVQRWSRVTVHSVRSSASSYSLWARI